MYIYIDTWKIKDYTADEVVKANFQLKQTVVIVNMEVKYY